MFTSNHLGHFLLTNLLLPSLEQSGYVSAPHLSGSHWLNVDRDNRGRIVNLASSMHRLATAGFDFDDVMSEKRYSLFGTYGQSKLANILFTKELDRR